MALPYLFLPDHDDPAPRAGESRREPHGEDQRARHSGDAHDHERVLQIRAGNEAVYAELFTELHVPLREFATTYVGSATVAEEIVQDIFLDLWIRRAEWAPHRGIRAYLFRAVRNRATDAVRHVAIAERSQPWLAGESGVIGGEAVPLPDVESDLRDFALALRKVLNELPVARRRAAFLRWRHGLTFAEIAESMGISVASATMHVQRAREAIRPVVERYTTE